jgi:hypothetical protein
LIVFFFLVLLPLSCTPRITVTRQPVLAELSEQLSEPGGYFPSDNLISNELGYQKVLNKLDQLNVRGGVYLGVGPEQNFTYIAAVRPSRVILLDIRRDNKLQHLLYKALFVMARNRAEFLSLLFSRPLPRKSQDYDKATINDLVATIERLPPNEAQYDANLKKALTFIEKRFQVPLPAEDQKRIDFMYKSFYSEGLEIRYEAHSRRSWRTFPTLKELLVETDLSGRQRSFLASEDDFQFLRQLQEQDLIIPVTGDFAGPKALRAIGDYVRRLGERVSVFYTSNVEYYLLQQDSFSTFAESVKTLPHDEKTLFIRSYVGFGYQHPEALPGYFITTLLQRMNDFIRLHDAGEYHTYFDLGLLDYISIREPEQR